MSPERQVSRIQWKCAKIRTGSRKEHANDTAKMGMGTTSAGSVSEGAVSGMTQSSESMRQTKFSEFPSRGFHSSSSRNPVLFAESMSSESHIPNFGIHNSKLRNSEGIENEHGTRVLPCMPHEEKFGRKQQFDGLGFPPCTSGSQCRKDSFFCFRSIVDVTAYALGHPATNQTDPSVAP